MPAPAVDGLLCRTCSSRLSRWLSVILEDTLHLSTRIPDNYSWDHGHQHNKISGSPALIRLDVAALTDPRTLMDSDDTPGEPVYIIGKVTGWAGLLAEEHNLASPTNTMADAVQVLTNQWERLVNSEWIGEFYSDMATIRQLLNGAHNRRPPASAGACFDCDTEIRKEEGDGRDDATCRGCGRVYTGADLFKLHLQKNHDTLDRLIRDTIITSHHAREFIQLKYPQHPTPRESTIRSWLTRGNITTAPNGGIDLDSLKKWFLETRDQVQAHRRRRKPA